ncbi:MAG: hypothetical protein ACLQDY_24085 [Streptosporangiaceae bacterium]
MNLTSLQRKAVFAVIVVALAGLGWYLFLPALRGIAASHRPRAAGSTAAGSTAGRPGTARPTATTVPQPGASASPGGAPAPGSTSAAGSASPSAAATPDIYQWLPFTPAELGTAAGIARQFTADYATYSYSENAAGYLARMHGLITRPLALQLAAAYQTPGVASLRARQKQVATGTASIAGLRAFGPTSITFLVSSTEHLTDSRGRSQLSYQYVVTVAQNSGAWQVSGIEVSTVGNS